MGTGNRQIGVSLADLAHALDGFYLTVDSGAHLVKGQVSEPDEVASALYAGLCRQIAENRSEDPEAVQIRITGTPEAVSRTTELLSQAGGIRPGPASVKTRHARLCQAYLTAVID